MEPIVFGNAPGLLFPKVPNSIRRRRSISRDTGAHWCGFTDSVSDMDRRFLLSPCFPLRQPGPEVGIRRCERNIDYSTPTGVVVVVVVTVVVRANVEVTTGKESEVQAQAMGRAKNPPSPLCVVWFLQRFIEGKYKTNILIIQIQVTIRKRLFRGGFSRAYTRV